MPFIILITFHVGFPCGSAGKVSACNTGDLGSIPGLERSPREGKGYPLQYSDLENSMDCIVHGVAKSQARLSDFHSLHSLRLYLGVSTFHPPLPLYPALSLSLLVPLEVTGALLLLVSLASLSGTRDGGH